MKLTYGQISMIIFNIVYDEKYEDIEKHINDYDSVNKKCMLLLKNVDILSTEDLRNFCIDLFDVAMCSYCMVLIETLWIVFMCCIYYCGCCILY